MGVHTLTLCLLASAVLVIFAAVHKDCVHNNETYKHGETVPQECMICECDDGEVKDCQQTKDCATKKRRSLPEELAKVDFLNDPEVFESSFDRKKRSIVMPKLDDNLIDNIVHDGNAPEDDEDEPHDMDSEPGCLFNHESLAHGDNTSLNCLDCTCNKGAINCVRNFKCPGLCSVSGFQMIRTFDGSLYTSPGGCSYILVKTDDFSVYLNNKQCKENEEAVCIDSVEVHLASFVNVKLLSDGSIQTDDGVPALPYHINDLITVRRSSSMFVEVVSSAGFALQYDFKGNRLYVSMDVSRKDTTKGLCGTFNDNRNDDYMSSNGMLETVSSLFALSWKIHQYCDERRNTPENIDRMVAASDTCDSFLDESIFADCHAIIEVTSYKTACRNSVYYGEDLGGMCSALAEYAYQCAWAGITVAFRSSFSECELNCDDSLVRATSWQLSHRDCRDYSDQLLQFPATNLLNEVCICPHDQYYDSTLETCVSGNDCPCYANSRAYKVGEMVSFPNDKECPCQRVMECSDDIPSEPQDPVRECPDGEMYSDCSNGMGKSCEKNCQNLEMVDQSCPADCVPGCICSYGSYRDDEDQCVPISDCKCVHGGDIYNPGETMVQDCNTCTCQDGRFNCTYNPCPAICNAYGESQFILFDKVWKKFHTADCTIVLAQSEVEASPAFLVLATSVRSRQLAGSFSTKNVTIQFGSTYVVMTEFGTEVVYYPSHSGRNEVNTYRAGFYTVVDFPGMLSVYFDLHLDVVIQIQPKLRGKVLGMCGDADGVTTAEFSMGNMVQYGSQFLANECPHAPPPLPPPSGPHSTYVEERCGLLKSDIFLPCHTVVPVEWYYAACVEETASCREGESCLCFCTAVAAYARACCRNGISIDWRTADTCPAPCEYYNREAGEGPYHLVNMNQLRLVADPESGLVNLSPDSDAQVLPASFMITPGLYKDVNSARRPISLESALHPNYFITQDEDGSISLQKWQASVNFRKSATFIWRKNRWIKGYDALESFSQRGRYLTAGSQNSVSISKYSRASTQAASFKLTMESFGLPFFSLCLWRYKACEPPCIKTCQDPDGSRCSLTLNVEGCFPHCAEGLVFDEETHRCVNYKDCITEPTPTPEITTTPHNECKNVICNLTSCKVGAVPHRVVPRFNPCCEETTCDCLPCADPQECGHGLIAKPEFDPETECCPSYVCVCGVCLPPQSCPDGFILETSPDKQNACCPKYDCVPASTTARTTRTPTTTPQTSTTRDSCYDVTCSVPSCPKTGQSLQIADGHDGCCTQYTCECQQCPGVTDCGFDYITKTTFDTKKDCCPSHTCVCPTCPPEPQCAPGSVLRQIFNSQMVCCHDYECESLHTTPTTTTITTPSCEHAVCERPACKRSGSHLVLVEGEGADPCCPEYKCVCEKCPMPPPCASGYEQEVLSDPNHCCDQYRCADIQITTPAPTTTRRIPTTTLPPRCSGVTCAEMTCEKEGATPDIDERDDSCCPRYVCECQNTCPPDLYCGPGVQPIKTIDIERQCCPNQKCREYATNQQPKGCTSKMDATRWIIDTPIRLLLLELSISVMESVSLIF
ncbi:otogelin-like protein isoform X2 [Ambystoma mexicanum]|uniref:otogelin-like protein isoform X2 n=1 Tax=Ambystoma mexicanum TaxID=8296 RepID=UPI0037E90AF0